jgi:hypothetical protein
MCFFLIRRICLYSLNLKRKINCYNLGCYFICFILFNNKIGGIEEGKEEEITAFVNNKNVNNKGQKGKMNILRNQKRVPHTIVNIPTKDGVHFGVCIIFLSYYFYFLYLKYVSFHLFILYCYYLLFIIFLLYD